MTQRWDRLAEQQKTLIARLHVAAIRAVNAAQGVQKMEAKVASGAAHHALLQSYHMELCEAQIAHIEARAAHDAGEQALRMHTTNMCIQVLFLVVGRDGTQRVIERRSIPKADPEAVIYRDEFDGAWHNIDDADDARPMSFSEAIGADESYGGDEFTRLYTQDEVDAIIDRAEGYTR